MKNVKRNDNHAGYATYATILVGTIMAVIVVIIGISVYKNYKTERTLTVEVCGKEAVPTSNGHEYRVYTSGGTFVIKDHLVNGFRSTSADTYGKIKEDSTYSMTIYGWRNGLLSMFPNVVSVKSANTGTVASGTCNS